MKNKKLAILAAICLVTSMTAVTTACKKPKPTPSVVYEVSIDLETVDLAIGEEKQLTSTSNGVAGVAVAYASSDPSVATVDATGKVVALKAGTTTITATYGTATDTCVVNVGLGVYVPMLNLPNVTDDVITLDWSSALDLTGTVEFNEVEYEDATFTYEVADTAVGNVADGVFVPSGIGTTEITITASWRGVTDDPNLMKTFTVNVVPSWGYTINSEETYEDIKLYAVAKEGYATAMDFVVVASSNGQTLDSTIVITEGAEFVTYDETANTLTSKGVVGNARVNISVEIMGQKYEKALNVSVLHTPYVIEQTVTNFSAIHGDVANDGYGTYGKSLKEVVKEEVGENFEENFVTAYADDGTKLTVENNKVLGVFDGLERNADNTCTRRITIYAATRSFEMTVTGYDGIIAKAQDFKVFNTNYNAKTKVPVDDSKPKQMWTGYYVLANNIDASQYKHAANGEQLAQWGIDNPKNWLKDTTNAFGLVGGTFDGQGYTVKGMTFDQHGLFGYVSANSTIKNVAFTEAKLANEHYATVLAAWVNNSTISNVYVSVVNDEINGKASTPFVLGIQNSTVEACVIETKATLKDKETGLDGSFFYMSNDFTKASQAEEPDYSNLLNLSEVYVLSNEALGYYKGTRTVKIKNTETGEETTEEKEAWYHYLAGKETAPETVEDLHFYFTLNGVKKYSDATVMASATDNTFDKFDSSFWTITNGMPVWVSANGNFSAPVPDEEEPEQPEQPESGETNDIIVGNFKPDWLN